MKKPTTFQTFIVILCLMYAISASEAAEQSPLRNEPSLREVAHTPITPTPTVPVSYGLLLLPNGYHLHVESVLPGGLRSAIEVGPAGRRSLHIERSFHIEDSTLQRFKEKAGAVVMFVPKKIYSGLAFLGRGAKRLLWW